MILRFSLDQLRQPMQKGNGLQHQRGSRGSPCCLQTSALLDRLRSNEADRCLQIHKSTDRQLPCVEAQLQLMNLHHLKDPTILFIANLFTKLFYTQVNNMFWCPQTTTTTNLVYEVRQ